MAQEASAFTWRREKNDVKSDIKSIESTQLLVVQENTVIIADYSKFSQDKLGRFNMTTPALSNSMRRVRCSVLTKTSSMSPS